MLLFQWYCLQCQFILNSEKTSPMTLESWDQHVLYPGSHVINQRPWVLWRLSWMPPVITPILTSTPHLKLPPIWNSYQLENTKLHVPKVKYSTMVQQEQVGVASCDANEAGNFVVSDQYVVNTPDRLLSDLVAQFFMMLLLVLSQLRIKRHLEQVTLLAKKCFEKFLWESTAAEILHLRVTMGFLMPNFLLRIARIVPDSVVFWSRYSSLEWPYWRVNSNHHICGPELMVHASLY